MPKFTVTDPASGRRVTLTGDAPPTERELDGIFAELNANPAWAAPAAPNTRTADPFASYVVKDTPTGADPFAPYVIPDAAQGDWFSRNAPAPAVGDDVSAIMSPAVGQDVSRLMPPLRATRTREQQLAESRV